MSETIKCRIRITKVFYPKPTMPFQTGDWASFAAEVLEEIEGNVQLSKAGNLRVSGNVPELDTNREYTLLAKYAPHPQFGKQYTILCMNGDFDFESSVQQRQFLERVLSEVQINRLYEQLDNPFEAIKNQDIKALCSVKGIGVHTAEKIVAAYLSNIDNGHAYVELDEFGLTKYMIDKLIRAYKSADTLVAKIKENPYILIDEVDGIGWKKADELALAGGVDPQSRERVKAFIRFYLKNEAENGNTWIATDVMINAIQQELSLEDADTLRQALYDLNETNILWWDEEKTMFALTKVQQMEQQISNELVRLLSAPVQKPTTDFNAVIADLQEEQGWTYTDEQVAAIKLGVSSNVSIITGYGGTGKSTVVAAILRILRGQTFAQTALSGRAAARLSEITSEVGYTIHRLLGYNPAYEDYKYNRSNQLSEDIIILDEVSMVGAEMFLRLLEAIRSGSRLIMLGDDGQLESVGLCNVFKDMLDSGVVPVARLTKIHRQAAKSAIITESIRVRTANQLVPHGWVGNEIRGELQDLELDIYNDSILSQKHVISQFNKMFEQAENDISKIQIVLPQKYRGEICTEKINSIVQEIVNPHGKNEILINLTIKGAPHEYRLKENDKVIVNKNNYDTFTPAGDECPVYNGNRGTIKTIDKSKGQMIVEFDQWGEVVILQKLWNTIELAYALSCHKLQGSEAEFVIIGLDFSARTLLTREWLYTAITRAKKSCVLCAETNALNYCITNSNVPYKRTFLASYLKETKRRKDNEYKF